MLIGGRQSHLLPGQMKRSREVISKNDTSCPNISRSAGRPIFSCLGQIELVDEINQRPGSFIWFDRFELISSLSITTVDELASTILPKFVKPDGFCHFGPHEARVYDSHSNLLLSQIETK